MEQRDMQTATPQQQAAADDEECDAPLLDVQEIADRRVVCRVRGHRTR